jgi:hypothetical protein
MKRGEAFGIAAALVFSCVASSTLLRAGSDPDPTPPPVQPPVPTPTPSIAPIPTPEATGVMEFAVTPFANMEHGWHIFEPGYRAVCEDGSGVVATAKLTVDAGINGEAIPGNGPYPALIIRPAAQYIRNGASSGSCQMNICLDANAGQPSARASCQSTASATGNDSERATSWSGQVSYQVKGGSISLQTGAPGLSAWHPVFSFALPSKAFKDFQSPLVVDLDADGALDLVDVNQSKKNVRFDIKLEGRKVRTGWVGAKDALLAVDLNKNGKVDDAGELLGEYFSGAVLGPKPFRNGFDALASFDSNADGKVSAADSRFGEILVWNDRNQDGRSQRKELRKLVEVGIESVSLAVTYPMEKDGLGKKFQSVAGNEVRIRGSMRRTDGSDGLVADVWFQVRGEPLAMDAQKDAHKIWLISRGGAK